MGTALITALVLSPLDDLIVLGLLACLTKSRSGTTSSASVVDLIHSSLKGNIMTAKQTVAPVELSREDRVAQIMAQLRAPTKSSKSFSERFTDHAVDAVAGAGDTAARFAAAAASAVENASDAFQIERERQLKRRAERLLDQAEALAS